MLLVRIRAVALLVVATAAIGHGYQAGGQWPPPLQTVAEASPVLAPAASMKTIFTPPGYRLEKLAPGLVGSALALGPAAVTVRILLNGKEGPAGLMPPLGAAFDDEQVAAVLTYIRREWDQTGSPIDAATVKEIRALTAGRTRPWTAEELARIGGQ